MKLSNVKKGYVEFEWEFENRMYYGVVQLEKFVGKTDFEKDEIITTARWVPYLPIGGTSYNECIGRKTGYKTRQAALAAVKAYIREEVYTNETRL